MTVSDTLQPDQSLAADQRITSNNGRAFLIMQGDGNFVLYESWRGRDVPVWASGTNGHEGASTIMQGDGNLVVYTADGQALWDSGTWDNPGGHLVLQDDGNAVIYAQDGRALWASNTYRQSGRVGFDPSQHGFHFDNQFTNRVANIPGFGPVETRGRCGGMAYAALDYFIAGIPVPAYRSSLFSPSSVPPDGHWLADYILIRLMNSFWTPSAINFVDWTVRSDHQTWFHPGVTRMTKEREFPKLQKAIDGGTPVVLGLVGADNLGDVGNRNHQVVAYGYERHPQAGMIVFVYDNNYPDTEVVLSSATGSPHFDSTHGRAWRGFFVHDYVHVNPPVFTRQPPASSATVAHGATIKVSHLRTGRTLHSHALFYGHRGSSGQQQVTAFEAADDNDLWRVKGPDGTPHDYRAGQSAAHGDIIRLEHVLTARNLHSHAGHPSPVTGQQEVTCFGDGGIGDGNDNWRVEMEGGGVWSAHRRVRLIHEPTNHALHSHPGLSHPVWTAGQQEVTGFAERDDNDWWWVLEIR
jgi:hypothetical protein